MATTSQGIPIVDATLPIPAPLVMETFATTVAVPTTGGSGTTTYPVKKSFLRVPINLLNISLTAANLKTLYADMRAAANIF